MTIKVELERLTEPCSGCECDDDQLVVVVTCLGRPADHYCLSCASSLHNKLDRLLREVPKV